MNRKRTVHVRPTWRHHHLEITSCPIAASSDCRHKLKLKQCLSPANTALQGYRWVTARGPFNAAARVSAPHSAARRVPLKLGCAHVMTRPCSLYSQLRAAYWVRPNSAQIFSISGARRGILSQNGAVGRASLLLWCAEARPAKCEMKAGICGRVGWQQSARSDQELREFPGRQTSQRPPRELTSQSVRCKLFYGVPPAEGWGAGACAAASPPRCMRALEITQC